MRLGDELSSPVGGHRWLGSPGSLGGKGSWEFSDAGVFALDIDDRLFAVTSGKLPKLRERCPDDADRDDEAVDRGGCPAIDLRMAMRYDLQKIGLLLSEHVLLVFPTLIRGGRKVWDTLVLLLLPFCFSIVGKVVIVGGCYLSAPRQHSLTYLVETR